MTDEVAATREPAEALELIDDWQEHRRGGRAAELSRLGMSVGLFGSARANDLDELIRQLDDELEYLETKLVDVRRLRERADLLESRAETSSETWFKRVRRDLIRAFEKSPELGRDKWLATVAELLANWQIDQLWAVVSDQRWEFPAEDIEVVRRVRHGVAAVKDERYEEALDMICVLADHLSQVDGDRSRADGLRARLLAFAARIHLYRRVDNAAASALLDEADSVDDSLAFVRAIRGEIQIRRGDRIDAGLSFSEAIRLAPGEPDAYVGLGLLAEDECAWDRGRYMYDQAVAVADQQAIAGRLLAPAPANLHWQLAKKLERSGALGAALRTLERAIDLTVRGKGNHPDRKAYKHKAELLLAMGRAAEAGEAFYEAGRRYAWDSDVKRAESMLRQALTYAPDDSRASWYLADVLRVRSYDLGALASDAVDNPRNEAVELWQRAYEQGLPDPAWAWVYTSRAMLNEQLQPVEGSEPGLLWESVGYLERGVILNPFDAQAWAHLSRQHRMLGNGMAARSAAARSWQLADDGDSLSILTFEALARGDWEAAELAAERRIDYDASTDARHLWASTLFFSRGPRTCLEAVANLAAEHADSPELRELAAYAHYVLGEEAEAKVLYQWLWDNRGAVAHDAELRRTAWAAWMIGRSADAIDLYLQALDRAPRDRYGIRRELGQAQLRHGEVQAGADSLRDGISHISTVDEAVATEHDLRQLSRDADRWPDAPLVVDVIATAAEQLRVRKSEIEKGLSDQVPPVAAAAADLESTLVRTAMVLTAARHLSEVGDTILAARSYRSLVEEGLVPEASMALRHAIESAADIATTGMAGWDEAAARYAECLGLALPVLEEDGRFIVGLLARAAVANLVAGRNENGRELLTRVVSSTSSVGEIVDVMTEMMQLLDLDDSDVWTIDDHLANVLRDVGASPEDGRSTAGDVVPVVLGKRLSLSYDAAAADTLPIVDPVVLDLGSALFPTGPELELLFNLELPGLYERIKTETGVEVPAIPVVRVDRLDPNSYQIKLDEITVADGTVPPGMVFTTASSPSVIGSNHEVVDPLTMRAGTWLPRVEAGVDRIEVHATLDFVLRHVESVLRSVLDGFVGALEVGRWVAAYVAETSDERVAGPFRDDRNVRIGLVRLLRALLRETVPITDRARIVEVVLAANCADIGSLTPAARLSLRSSLSTSDDEILRVPASFETALAEHPSLDGDEGQRVIPRADAERLVHELRSWTAVHRVGSTRVVLSTGRADLRPALARLAFVAVPFAAVLAEEECAR